MKTIKFRIYDPKEKRMIESGGTPMMLHSFFEATATLNVKEGMDYLQFTGLTDRQGKEIYEGDIVKVRGLKEKQIIGFDVGYLCYCFIYDTGEIMRKITPREMLSIEVIGNIYENPTLLKSNEK